MSHVIRRSLSEQDLSREPTLFDKGLVNRCERRRGAEGSRNIVHSNNRQIDGNS
jgi:hypothetical protein